MRSRVIGARALGAIVVALLVAPSASVAAIPDGNLLANPGFEEGTASVNATDVLPVAGWSSASAPGATAVRYGTPGAFPEAGVAFGIQGGTAFAAGGPLGAATESSLVQVLDVSVAASEIDAGAVQATLKACLGGSGEQADDVVLRAVASAGTTALGTTDVRGPTPGERSLMTSLLPLGSTFDVPVGTRQVTVALLFRRSSADPYADGYADNVALFLSPRGAPVTTPDCDLPAPAPGIYAMAAAAVPSPAALGAAQIAATRSSALPRPAVSVARLGRDRTLTLPVRCATGDGRPCTGRLRLSVAGLGALGTKAFAVGDGATARIALRLSRAKHRRLARIARAAIRVAFATRDGASRTYTVRLRR